VADYSVDIKIAVAGSRELKAARKETTALSKEITTLNRLANKQSKTLPNSFNNLNKVLGQAKGNLNKVALGTTRYLRAINDVIDKEERLNRAYRKQKTDFKVIQRLRMKGLDINKQNIQAVRDELAAEIKLARAKKRTAKAEKEGAISNKRRNRIIQSAGIGGGFPLLFGGGIQGALAGGLGGGIGEALSPGGGFAGSIVATAVMRMATDFANGITEVGKAMNESSKEFERVQNILGEEGANKISAFATETQLLTKTSGDFFISMQSGIGGLITTSGILANIIASMQRGLARNQVLRSDEFKQRVKGLKSKGVQGQKRTAILNEMTDAQFEKNVQGTANVQADTSFELIQAEINGLEREGFLHDANTEKMRKALEIRYEHQDIMEKLVKSGAVISDQESDMILDLLDQKQLRQDNLDLQNFLKENAKERRSLEDQDQKNYDDAIKKLDKLKESSNSVTKNLEDQNKLNLIKLSGSEYDIALTQAKIGLTKEELALFDEEAFKIAYNNKLRIDGLTKQKQITEDIKNLLATEMSTAIKGLITGANSLNDAFRNILNKMADAFLNIGLFGNVGGSLTKGGGLLGTLFGGLLATGGPAKAGKSYIVGEQGPELFTPGVSGMVSPNNALGGSTNVVVNVDASGSSVEGDEDRGRELGRLISVAVQSELVQQKRPGGLLA
jgi:hypothetical protein